MICVHLSYAIFAYAKASLVGGVVAELEAFEDLAAVVSCGLSDHFFQLIICSWWGGGLKPQPH